MVDCVVWASEASFRCDNCRLLRRAAMRSPMACPGGRFRPSMASERAERTFLHDERFPLPPSRSRSVGIERLACSASLSCVKRRFFLVSRRHFPRRFGKVLVSKCKNTTLKHKENSINQRPDSRKVGGFWQGASALAACPCLPSRLPCYRVYILSVGKSYEQPRSSRPGCVDIGRLASQT